MPISPSAYDKDITEQGAQFQIDHYYEPKNDFGRKRIERVLGFMKPQKGDRILDIGCGVGTFAFHAARKGAEALGVDYSRQSIMMAVELSSRYDIAGKLGFAVADATNLPFAMETFDKVCLIDFVEHLDSSDTQKAIDEALRVTRLGGNVLIYTPNKNAQVAYIIMKKFMAMLRFQNPTKISLLGLNPKHIGLESPRSLQRYLQRSGHRARLLLVPRRFGDGFGLVERFLQFSSSRVPVIRTYLAERILLVVERETLGETSIVN